MAWSTGSAVTQATYILPLSCIGLKLPDLVILAATLIFCYQERDNQVNKIFEFNSFVVYAVRHCISGVGCVDLSVVSDASRGDSVIHFQRHLRWHSVVLNCGRLRASYPTLSAAGPASWCAPSRALLPARPVACPPLITPASASSRL